MQWYFAAHPSTSHHLTCPLHPRILTSLSSRFQQAKSSRNDAAMYDHGDKSVTIPRGRTGIAPGQKQQPCNNQSNEKYEHCNPASDLQNPFALPHSSHPVFWHVDNHHVPPREVWKLNKYILSKLFVCIVYMFFVVLIIAMLYIYICIIMYMHYVSLYCSS